MAMLVLVKSTLATDLTDQEKAHVFAVDEWVMEIGRKRERINSMSQKRFLIFAKYFSSPLMKGRENENIVDYSI